MCTMQCAQCNVHSAMFIVQCVQCIVHSVMCIVQLEEYPHISTLWNLKGPYFVSRGCECPFIPPVHWNGECPFSAEVIKDTEDFIHFQGLIQSVLCIWEISVFGIFWFDRHFTQYQVASMWLHVKVRQGKFITIKNFFVLFFHMSNSLRSLHS